MKSRLSRGEVVEDNALSIRSFLILGIGISLMLSFKLNSILIGLFLLHTIIKTNWKEVPAILSKRIKYALPYLLFFGLYLISLSYSEDLGFGLKDLESKLSLLLLPLAFLIQRPLIRKELHFILLAFSIFTLAIGLISVLVSLISVSTISTNQELSGMLGIHASYLSIYSLLGLATFVYFGQKNISRIKPKVFYLLSLIQFGLILLLAARIIILSFILIGFLWLLFFNYSRKKMLLFIILLISIGIVGYSVEGVRSRFIEAVNFEDGVELDTELSEHRTLNQNYGGRAIRIAIWECSVPLVKSHWLFGVGAGDVHDHLQQAYKDRQFEFAWKYNNYNAHNLFLETIIGVGILGLILLFFIFAMLFRLSFKTENLICLTFTVSFLMLSLMESSFNVQKGLVFFLIFSLSFLNAEKKALDDQLNDH